MEKPTVSMKLAASFFGNDEHLYLFLKHRILVRS